MMNFKNLSLLLALAFPISYLTGGDGGYDNGSPCVQAIKLRRL
ncbi:hypothetical protein [Streptococcus porci]|nr:hypothetical protein [Streptococcus porci]